MAILIDTQIRDDLYATGSIQAAGGLTGSLLGTASWATNVLSGVALTGSLIGTASWANTASYARTASFGLNMTASSLTILGTTSGSTVSCSTIFSPTVIGNITGSTFGTASWATTASWADKSPATTLQTGSTYLITASWANTASYAKTSSFGLNMTASGINVLSTIAGTLMGDVTGSLSGSSIKTKDLYSVTGMYFPEGTDQWSFGPVAGGAALLRGSSNLLEVTGSNGTLILGRNQTFVNVNVGSPKLVLVGARNSFHLQPSILGTIGDNSYGALYNIVGYDHSNVHIGFDCQFNGTTWNGATEASSSFLISKTTDSMSFLAGIPGDANDIVWVEAMNITGSGLVRMTGSVFGTSSQAVSASWAPYIDTGTILYTGSTYQITSSWAATSSVLSNGQCSIYGEADTIEVRDASQKVFVFGDQGGSYNQSYIPISASSVIANLTGTASWATTASFASQAQTASFLLSGVHVVTSSWAITASHALSLPDTMSTSAQSLIAITSDGLQGGDSGDGDVLMWFDSSSRAVAGHLTAHNEEGSVTGLVKIHGEGGTVPVGQIKFFDNATPSYPMAFLNTDSPDHKAGKIFLGTYSGSINDIKYVWSSNIHGDVGVSTADPQARLHVSGSIYSNTSMSCVLFSGSQVSSSNVRISETLTSVNYSGSSITSSCISSSDAYSTKLSSSYISLRGTTALENRIVFSCLDSANAMTFDIRISSASLKNTMLGRNAGGAILSGSNNTCVGNGAGNGITYGSYNTCIGPDAGTAITSGSNNTIIGSTAYAAGNGTANTIIGVNAARNVGSFNSNVVIGQAAVNIGGKSAFNSNVVLGNSAFNVGEGSQNVIIGKESAAYVSTGSNNIFIGHQAGYNISASRSVGGNNVVIGTNTAYNLFETSSNNILIGYSINLPEGGSGSGQLTIGNLIFGDGLGTTTNRISPVTGSVAIGCNIPDTDGGTHDNKLYVGGNISASNVTASNFVGTSSWANDALHRIVRISSSYTISGIDQTVVCLHTASITLTLPTASSVGVDLNIKNGTSGSWNIVVSGSELIDNQSNVIINSPYSSMHLLSDGYQWWIL